MWYPKAAWDQAGYEIPTTWDEMLELTELIADDGDTAWCIGIESGAATGWAATDWMEEVMLRTTSLENYDKWTRGELPFDSPEVRNAVETMSEIWLNEDYVYVQEKYRINLSDFQERLLQLPNDHLALLHELSNTYKNKPSSILSQISHCL